MYRAMQISDHNRYVAFYVNFEGYSVKDWHEYLVLSPENDDNFIPDFNAGIYNTLLRTARNGGKLLPIRNMVPVTREVIKDFKCVDKGLYEMLEGRVRMKMRDLTVIELVIEEV